MDIGGALDGFAVEQVSVTTAEPIVVLEWQGGHADGRRASGTDTFIIEDDKIQAPNARVQRELATPDDAKAAITEVLIP